MIVPAAIKFTAASTAPLTPTKATKNSQIEFVGSCDAAIAERKVSFLQKKMIIQLIKKNVFRSAVAREAAKYGAVFIFPVFCIALNSSPESQPHNILGTIQVIKVPIGFRLKSSTPNDDAPKH